MDKKETPINSEKQRIQELEVISSELSHLKPNACVYQKQNNTNIFFKVDKSKLHSNVKKELKDLKHSS